MKTVLFIDDNADIRENTAEILELAHYKVLTAADGKEGVALALEQRPDIIICDIMMPELDGYGVIHMLQKNSDTQSIPFIFLTAKAERTDLRKGMELGADDYITKPFSATELLNAIEGRLRKAETIKTHIASGFQGMTAIIGEYGSSSLKEAFEKDQESRSYPKKARIYAERQKPYRLFYVERGKVKLYKTNDDGKEFITGICQSGEFFGYSALLEGVAYRETAEALEDSEICSITREVFEQLLHENPGVARDFIKLLAGNVHEKAEQLLSVAYNSLRKKVANALLVLNSKYKSGASSNPAMHVSRDNLAAIAGTAKESLVRTLGDFRDEKLIEIRDSNIIVLEEKKLANLVN